MPYLVERTREPRGGCSRRDTDHVYDFLGWDAEVVGDVDDAVARNEPVDQILCACTAAEQV
jgi:hypothetical protein